MLLICSLCISFNIHAQFKGGDANGGDSKILTQTVCMPSENTNIYFGGNANGDSVASFYQTACLLPDNINICFGGSGNGASYISLLQTACTNPENLNVFFGGKGGCFTTSFISCIPADSFALYLGGMANGASSVYIDNCPIIGYVNIFNGGIADGYSENILTQVVCTMSENINIFFGGYADGYATLPFDQTICLVSENYNIFEGGNNDGYDSSSLVQTICSPPENSNIFAGGIADGFERKLLIQLVCPLPENYNIFSGGNSDGYILKSLLQSICPVSDNYSIYMGGDAEGYAVNSLVQSVCVVPANLNVFAGGNSDGYSFVTLSQTVCSSALNNNVFAGGNSDGFTTSTFIQSACSVPENGAIFLGGIDNGYAFQYFVSCTPVDERGLYMGGRGNGASTTSIIYCPVTLYAVNIYIGGSTNGASSALLNQSVCTAPENTNVYKGGNANGAAKAIVMQTVCALPENTNIYYGGAANGAANKRNMQSVCPPADNLSIYFGGVGNGASRKAVMQTVCPLAQNWNVFFGGINDGFATGILSQVYYWTGSVDHNWHNPANWSKLLVPDINSFVNIPNVANNPIISAGSAVSKSIVIEAGALLNVNKDLTTEFNIMNDGTITFSGSPTLSIGGNLLSYGTYNAGNSKLIMTTIADTQQLKIDFGSVYDLEIKTTALSRCLLMSDITVRNNITITTGILDAANNRLEVAGNWSNSSNFVSGTSTVSFNGSNQLVSNVAAEVFYNLITTNNTQLTTNSNITISNNLSLQSAIITTGVNKIIVGTGIGNPGSLTFTSGRVIGKMERWIVANGTYIFPVGTLLNMETVNITVNNITTPGSVIVNYYTGNPGIVGLPLSEAVTITKAFTEGYWNFVASNGLVLADYDLMLNANGFISYFLNNESRILKRTNGGSWVLDGTHTDAVASTCYRNNLTGGVSTSGTQFGIGAFSFVSFASSDLDNTICSGESVTFTAGGGTNYVFKRNGAIVQSGAANVYTTTSLTNGASVKVIVTNASSYTDSSSAIVTAVNALPSVLFNSSDIDNIICAGNSVTFTAGGGTNYNFKVDGTSIQNGFGTTYMTSALTNGASIKVIVSTMNACVDSSSAILTTVNALPIVTFTSSDVDNSICVGTSVTFIAGGGSNYNFKRNGISVQNGVGTTYSSTSFTNGTNMKLIVTNICGCIDSSLAIVTTVNALPTATATSNSPRCVGTSLILTGGANGLLSYVWSGPSAYSNGIQSPTVNANATLAMAGTYNLTVTDANSCTQTASAVVIINSLPTAGITPDPAVICAGGTLAMNGNAAVGTGPYTHVWSGAGAAYISNTSIVNPNFIGAPAGSYALDYTVNDANSCTATDNLTVTVNVGVSSGITPNPANVCSGVNYALNGNPSGGTLPYTHLWTGAGTAHLSSTAIVNPNFNHNVVGAYALTYRATDANGCYATDNVSVTVNSIPTPNISPDPAVVCTGGTLILNGNAAGGSGSYATHLWTGNGKDSLNNKTIQSPSFKSKNMGTFKLIYSVTDDNNCVGIDSLNVTVNQGANATFTVLATADTICSGGNTSLRVDFTSGTAPYSFTWSDGTNSATLNNINSDPYDYSPSVAPIWTAGKYTATSYTITTITDSNGCNNSNIIGPTVRVMKRPATGNSYYVPNDYNK